MNGARHITEAEIKRIDKCLAGTRNEVRNRAIIMFLAYTGCRVQEAFKVKVSDVFNMASGTMNETFVLRKTKGGKDRKVFVPKKLSKHISLYLKKFYSETLCVDDLDNPLFPSERSIKKAIHPVSACRLVNRILSNAGVDTTSHGLRKAYCFNLRVKNPLIDLEQIRTLMGHSSILTTQIYWRADEIEAKKAVSNLDFG
jgi:integrase/recombinase XerD